MSAYRFLYPAGHFGLTVVTFLITLPLMQVIVVFLLTTLAGIVGFAEGVLAATVGIVEGDIEGMAFAIEATIFGELKWNPDALNLNH